ncbi:hypothetical protein DFH09DRAFT_1184992 [Mycena vulgaris]|nr:hypothetical protein DFH09DRAFT_1184992 [Mycena vulgaris]
MVCPDLCFPFLSNRLLAVFLAPSRTSIRSASGLMCLVRAETIVRRPELHGPIQANRQYSSEHPVNISYSPPHVDCPPLFRCRRSLPLRCRRPAHLPPSHPRALSPVPHPSFLPPLPPLPPLLSSVPSSGLFPYRVLLPCSFPLPSYPNIFPSSRPIRTVPSLSPPSRPPRLLPLLLSALLILSLSLSSPSAPRPSILPFPSSAQANHHIASP